MKFDNLRRICFLLLAVSFSVGAFAQTNYYNVTKFGAKADSSTLNTKAIAKAIEAASKKGGGTVYFPAGKYLTGPIHFKSNITIYLDAGAELHFSDNFDHYLPMVEGRYEGVDVTTFSPLFYANRVSNIAIKGRGLVDGHGKKWWDFVEGYKADQPRSKWQYMFDSLNKNILLPDEPRQMTRGFLRPPFIQTMYCENVMIEGITIQNSPFWTVNPQFTNNITIHAVTVLNPKRLAPNTDGINPESCKNVTISDCYISVGDDCITIKSGKDLPGRTKATPCENITITNSTLMSGHGGVVIGSEMSGGVKNVVISNCVFDGTDRGIRIKTMRGRGGAVEDFRVSNIVMKNILYEAIVLNMEYGKTNPEPVSERTPELKNIRISNVTAYAKQAIRILGLDEMTVKNISFNDLYLVSDLGVEIKNAEDIEFHNVTVNNKTGAAMKATGVSRITIDNFKNQKPVAGSPLMSFDNVKHAFLYNNWPVTGSTNVLDVKGNSQNIFLNNNNFNLYPQPVSQTDALKEQVIIK